MDKLARYFSEQNESPTSLAIRIGRSPSTLTRALNGQRDPSVRLAREVEAGTGGEVTAAEFMAICLNVSKSEAA